MLKRGFVPVIVPFFRLRARVDLWAETLRYQPLEALAFMTATVLVPMILSVLPPPPTDPTMQPSQPSFSLGNYHPLPAQGDALPAYGSFARGSVSDSRTMPASAKKVTVARVEAPAQTTAAIEREDREGSEEASLQDQILNFVSNPGSAPMTGCEGNLPC